MYCLRWWGGGEATTAAQARGTFCAGKETEFVSWMKSYYIIILYYKLHSFFCLLVSFCDSLRDKSGRPGRQAVMAWAAPSPHPGPASSLGPETGFIVHKWSPIWVFTRHWLNRTEILWHNGGGAACRLQGKKELHPCALLKVFCLFIHNKGTTW